MCKANVVPLKNPEITDVLTEMIRVAAHKIVAAGLEQEVHQLLESIDDNIYNGKSRVVRNGYLPERQIMTGVGCVAVKVPRLRDRANRTDKIMFHSSLIPPYIRRTQSIEKVLPLLYLKGISERDFVEALSPIFGKAAKNLSPGVISRLKSVWEEELATWQKRSFSTNHYVYWWVDGIHFGARSSDNRCVLVVMGVNQNGKKELLALCDGFRESTESWLELLRDLKTRGINAPKLIVGDGALGFWNAVVDVFPNAIAQRCWFHKSGNVLDKLPKSQQERAKSRLHEIWMSSTRDDAYKAFDAFIAAYEAKYPKATECLAKDKKALLAFYDFPAEHWAHIRTTNAIESVFATVRHRTYKAKGAFSSKTIMTMAFKLMLEAEKRWQRLRGFHQLDNVIRGIPFKDGMVVDETKNTALIETKKVQVAA